MTTVVVALATACNGAATDDIVFVQNSELFPFESLSDWVTYADQVPVVEIVAEDRMNPTGGSDMVSVGRLVAAKVERTIWSGSDKPVEDIAFVSGGWGVLTALSIVPLDGGVVDERFEPINPASR